MQPMYSLHNHSKTKFLELTVLGSCSALNCGRWSHLTLTVDCHHAKCVASSRQESCSSEDSVCHICPCHIMNFFLQKLPGNSSSSVGKPVACDLTVPLQTVYTVPSDGDAGDSGHTSPK